MAVPRAQTPSTWLVTGLVSCRLEAVRARRFAWNNNPIARPVIALVDSDPRRSVVPLRAVAIPRAQTPPSRLASGLVTGRLDSISSWRENGDNDLLEYPVAWPMVALVHVYPRRTAVAFAAMQLPCR